MRRRNESAAELLILCPWWVSVALAAAAFAFLHHLEPRFSGLAWPATLMLLFLGFASAIRSPTSALLFRRSVDLDALAALSWDDGLPCDAFHVGSRPRGASTGKLHLNGNPLRIQFRAVPPHQLASRP
jgi:hypothetical protein